MITTFGFEAAIFYDIRFHIPDIGLIAQPAFESYAETTLRVFVPPPMERNVQ